MRAMGQTQLDVMMLRGGLDIITPTLSLPAGAARQSLNFECAVSGGYSHIMGYERFDGRPSPSAMASAGTHRYISVTAFISKPAIGATVHSSEGGTGVVASINGLTLVLTKVTPVWNVGDLVTTGSTYTDDLISIGTVDSITAGPIDPEDDAVSRAAVADIWRADIHSAPGAGPIRGVAGYNDNVYAFHDDISGTNIGIYKSSSTGWTLVPLNNTVAFTLGGTGVPADGDMLTQGGVTATIKRVAAYGSWQAHTAAGQFVIGDTTGGDFAAGAATAGGISVTLSGAQVAQTITAGGHFEFVVTNFAGQAVTKRLYFTDGVNMISEFDGTVLVQIPTAAVLDSPVHIAAHQEYLFCSIASSVFYSTPGLPYDWTAIGGAGEIPTGDIVTGIISMPSDANSRTLGILNQNNIQLLYQRAMWDGGFSNWTLVNYQNGVGGISHSAQNMGQTFVMDDRGVNSLQTSLQFGNFTSSTLTNNIFPFINSKVGMLSASTLCRRKSQYRLFFNDGYALFITLANNKLLGCMPIYFPNPVTCAFEGKTSTGQDVIYFGSSNGYVYQMEQGTSFDGAPIDFYLITNYSNAKSPRTLKKYQKAVPELSSEQGSFASFDFSYLLGYNSGEYEQPASDNYGQYLGQINWDSFVWDNFFWDSNRNGSVEIPLDGTAENIAIVISGSSNYTPAFNLNSILIHYLHRRMMR